MHQESITWEVHRAKENPVKTLLVGIFIVLFLLFTLLAFGSILTVIAILVLGTATHTYFLPITYTFNEIGVTIDKRIFSYTYEWSRFRRFFLTTGGIVLSPFERPNFLDNFRGVHLLLPKTSNTSGKGKVCPQTSSTEVEKIIAYLSNRFPAN